MTCQKIFCVLLGREKEANIPHCGVDGYEGLELLRARERGHDDPRVNSLVWRFWQNNRKWCEGQAELAAAGISIPKSWREYVQWAFQAPK